MWLSVLSVSCVDCVKVCGVLGWFEKNGCSQSVVQHVHHTVMACQQCKEASEVLRQV